ncbi:Rhodanese-like domain-containing protein [Haematococcus lacustris]
MAGTGPNAKVEELFAQMSPPGLPVVSSSAVWSRIQERDPKLLLIDVRSPEEQQVSMLPGRTLTQARFEAEKEQHKAAKPDIVAYCTLGARSGKLAQQLTKEGFQVANLQGGILGWSHEGLPLVARSSDGSELSTTQVHVWAEQFALQGPGYQAVWFPTQSPRGLMSWLVSWFWMTKTKHAAASTSS